MSKIARIMVAGLLLAVVAAPAAAQGRGPWVEDLPTAQRMAEQQHRLVLIHFWGDNCPPCKKMEQQVFPRSEVKRALTSNYVAVKVNVRDAPELAQRYGVNRWPTDVIVTPAGELVDRSIGAMSANNYIAMIDRAAALQRAGMQVTNDHQIRTTAYDPGANQVIEQTNRNSSFIPRQSTTTQQTPQRPAYERLQRNTFVTDTSLPNDGARVNSAHQFQSAQPGVPAPVAPPYGQPYRPGSTAASIADDPRIQRPPAGLSNPTIEAQRAAEAQPRFATGNTQGSPYSPQDAHIGDYDSPPAGSPTTPGPQTPTFTSNPHRPPAAQPAQQTPQSLPPGAPPLALEGHCAVTLVDEPQMDQKWTKGDPTWGVIHDGRLYLFAGPQQQQRFLAAPHQYAPALSGADVVNLVENGRMIEGNIRFGVFYGDQIFLFNSDQSLRRFWEDPERFANQAEIAQRRREQNPRR